VVRRKWRLINEELKRQRKVHVQTVMVDTEPDRFEQDTLVIRFPYQTNADLFAKRLSEFGGAVSLAVESVVGFKCRVRPEFGSKGPGAAKPGGPPARPPVRPQPEASRRPAEAPQPEQRSERPVATAAPTVAPSTAPAASRPPAANGGNPHLTHDILEIFDGEIIDGNERK
jgi:hypothetical protein